MQEKEKGTGWFEGQEPDVDVYHPGKGKYPIGTKIYDIRRGKVGTVIGTVRDEKSQEPEGIRVKFPDEGELALLAINQDMEGYHIELWALPDGSLQNGQDVSVSQERLKKLANNDVKIYKLLQYVNEKLPGDEDALSQAIMLVNDHIELVYSPRSNRFYNRRNKGLSPIKLALDKLVIIGVAVHGPNNNYSFNSTIMDKL